MEHVDERIGCCCIDDFYAEVQACVDQLVGFKELMSATVKPISAAVVFAHTEAVCEALQEALNDMAENHGTPDLAHQAGAANWLSKKMLS